jgi:hypothetical protein
MSAREGFHAITDRSAISLQGAVKPLLQASGLTYAIAQIVKLSSTSFTRLKTLMLATRGA